MFEYAASNGEGTLIEYGMTEHPEEIALAAKLLVLTLIIGPAAPDCTTGE